MQIFHHTENNQWVFTSGSHHKKNIKLNDLLEPNTKWPRQVHRTQNKFLESHGD